MRGAVVGKFWDEPCQIPAGEGLSTPFEQIGPASNVAPTKQSTPYAIVEGQIGECDARMVGSPGDPLNRLGQN
jgi:hypothetical protein